MKILRDLRLPFDHAPEALEALLERHGVALSAEYRIVRRSLDARRKAVQGSTRRMQWVYTVEVSEPGDLLPPEPGWPDLSGHPARPVVVGSGPGGLFAALALTCCGRAPILCEQGAPLSQRVADVAGFIRRGRLKALSNFCFGAGGAGAFSDGKLTYRGKSAWKSWVLRALVECGAPEFITSRPDAHLGSNGLRAVLRRLLETLKRQGVTLRYHTRVVALETRAGRISAALTDSGERFETDAVFLACGHSARSVFSMAEDAGARLCFKPFAVGVRMAHPQALIDRAQYGDWAGHPALEPACYRLAHTDAARGRACYSFCMCPGGSVLNVATEPDAVVTNGASNRQKRSGFANAGLVVNVSAADVAGPDWRAGLEFQADLERRAALVANPAGSCRALPAQRAADFLDGRASTLVSTRAALAPLAAARLDTLLPPFVASALADGLRRFERRVRGLLDSEALLVGVETRTSSPVRIERDANSREALGVHGLYPVGEGAGHAGGIMSAAIDGIESARAFARRAGV